MGRLILMGRYMGRFVTGRYARVTDHATISVFHISDSSDSHGRNSGDDSQGRRGTGRGGGDGDGHAAGEWSETERRR